MNMFVYRLPSPALFVYCISRFMIHKAVCGLQNVHKLFCNFYIQLQCPAITKYLKNVFESVELEEKVVGSILEYTTQHGTIRRKNQNQAVKLYNLDAIISVGYRDNSSKVVKQIGTSNKKGRGHE